jgi:TrmH family RNA methyltransferase
MRVRTQARLAVRTEVRGKVRLQQAFEAETAARTVVRTRTLGRTIVRTVEANLRANPWYPREVVPTITSRQHAFVQKVRKVARGDERLSVLDGWHLVGEAIDAGIELEAVALSIEPPDAGARAYMARVTDAGTPVWRVSGSVMDALSPVRTPSGIVALARRRTIDEAEVVSPVPGLVVVGVNMQDPGNVGATIRAAEAGGATGVWLAGDSADPWGWKALRAAMGSTFRLPVLRTADVVDTCARLRARGLRVVATVPRNGVPMDEIDLRAPTAVLLGGEGHGLTADLLTQADIGVSIPMQAPVESLNVAVAAALLVYEARRQRL